jgi:hypothetical protein
MPTYIESGALRQCEGGLTVERYSFCKHSVPLAGKYSVLNPDLPSTMSARWRNSGGPPRKQARSRPIVATTWNAHRHYIEDWHNRGLSVERILVLLLECRFKATSVFRPKLIQKANTSRRKDQLWRKMQSWELTRDNKGQGSIDIDHDLSSAVRSEELYDAMDDDYLDESANVGPDHESSNGTANMYHLRCQHPRSTFRVGTVFADVYKTEVVSNRYKVKLWAVASSSAFNGKVPCIRIKSFGGRGVRGIDSIDQWSGGAVNPYAIVHCGDRAAAQDLAQETKTRQPLALTLVSGLPENAFSNMSCALLNTHRQISCSKHLVLIGHFDVFSTALLEVYLGQLLGER